MPLSVEDIRERYLPPRAGKFFQLQKREGLRLTGCRGDHHLQLRQWQASLPCFHVPGFRQEHGLCPRRRRQHYQDHQTYCVLQHSFFLNIAYNYCTSHQSLVAALSGPPSRTTPAVTWSAFTRISACKKGIRLIVVPTGTSALSLCSTG